MFTLNCKGRLLLVDKPLVIGIINTTPDSFFANSRYQGTDAVLYQAEKMLKDGATILDIGGQSTRPGSERVSQEEELKRVIVPIEKINKNFPEAFISIDTYFSKVANEAVNAGASIINDVRAGSIDENMISAVAALQVPYILMHMQGNLETMQQNPQYENVVTEVLDFFAVKTAALKKAGINDIIIDPGFGFGKTIGHNFQLLKDLSVFKILELPLLVGISRKSIIYKTLATSPQEALNGTTVLNTIALMNSASILRVHDVKEAVEAIKLYDVMKSS